MSTDRRRVNKRKTYRLSAVFWKEGRRIVGKCAELGVSSFGKDFEQAKRRLVEAVDLYLDNAKALGMLPSLEPALSSKDRFTAVIEIPA